jgi:hypothetical protein
MSTQPPNHRAATVRVSVTGLALSCYNPNNTPKWEVGLLHHPDHHIKISVNRFSPDTGKWEQSSRDIKPNQIIRITALHPKPGSAGQFKQDSGPINRQNPGAYHPEDLRWIVDFEKEFNAGNSIALPPLPEVTKLYVDHPYLYADADDKRHELTLLHFDSGTEIPYGTLGETCKADITCQPSGSVSLSVDGDTGPPLVFPHIPGKTHVIRIENECEDAITPLGTTPPTDTVRTDFGLYFPLLNLTAGTFDVLVPEGRLGTDAVCNPGFLGVRTDLLTP